MLYQSSPIAQTGTLKLKRLLARVTEWIAAASAALSDSQDVEGLRDAELDELGLRRLPKNLAAIFAVQVSDLDCIVIF